MGYKPTYKWIDPTYPTYLPWKSMKHLELASTIGIYLENYRFWGKNIMGRDSLDFLLPRLNGLQATLQQARVGQILV